MVEHPVFTAIRDIQSLQIFMEAHVVAVWDFMSLVKRLQRDLTCVDVPWLPAADPLAARFVNEIVLAEESDEDGQGGFLSHFGLYRRQGKPRPLTISAVASLLELSLGLSAWKSYNGNSWSLRMNPSSGDLHPTECHLILPPLLPLPGIGGGVFHYDP